MVKHKVSTDGRAEIEKIHKKLVKNTMTKDGKRQERERIIGKLFDERISIVIRLDIYISVLETLKECAVLFQAKGPNLASS